MADNESKIVQKIKYVLRNAMYGLSYGNLASNDEGTKIIEELIERGEPFMACRIGATEASVIHNWMSNKVYSGAEKERAVVFSGIFPGEDELLYRFSEIYTDAIKEADVIFTWGCRYEASIIKKNKKKDAKILRDTTNLFLFNDELWTKCLANKRVLVITPFVYSSEKQYEKRDKLFDREILPQFKSIAFVRTVQSSAGEAETCGYASWTDALESMYKMIDEQEDYDIALIAGGAYGIPLASYIKRKGKQAIHLASHLQILFGIRGKRFDNWPDWAEKMNEHWVYPCDEETPKNKHKVEGGSYWK